MIICRRLLLLQSHPRVRRSARRQPKSSPYCTLQSLLQSSSRSSCCIIACPTPAARTTLRHASSLGPQQNAEEWGLLKVYNSLSGRVEPIVHSPSSPDNHHNGKGIACYTCGPTVYAPSHLGHARTYVWLDILRRCLELETANNRQQQPQAPPPLFVMNITDVDDKILAAAAAGNGSSSSNEPPLQLARRFEAEFWADWDALNCLRPHVVTRVSEYVDSDIVPYIERLVLQGMAYEIANESEVREDGDGGGDDPVVLPGVYFHTRAYEERRGARARTRHGSAFQGISEEEDDNGSDTAAPTGEETGSSERPETTTTVLADRKLDPRDFVLWKKRKPGEAMYWNSPWGEGRPGWHIECSAMIESVQTQFEETHTFSIHAGGVDLQFPHHTNEIAQSEAYHCCEASHGHNGRDEDEEWIRHWVHTGQLRIDGLKMSKSLKNFITIQGWLEKATANAPKERTEEAKRAAADDFRLWCLGLSGSYRGTATFSETRMAESRSIREKIVRYLMMGEEWLRRRCESGDSTFAVGRETKKLRDEERAFYAALHGAAIKGRQALLSDLDGATFVRQLVQIAEDGTSYLQQEASEHGPIEPVKASIDVLRSLLSQVGFSNVTCRAGLATDTADGSHGMDRALLDELTKFRAAVRRAAIDDHRDKTSSIPSENMKHILKLCDGLRRSLPTLGVELLDASVTGADGEKDDWRFCTPHSADDAVAVHAANSSKGKAVVQFDAMTVAAQDLFRVDPKYEGMFSAYDEDGIPIRHADGLEVSKTQQKKFRKKQNKHAKLLEKT